MELRTLRAFVEVVSQGGFTQAARVVNATQSTVSKAVKQLETELGVELLERVGHRNLLTGPGEVVFRRGRSILAERDDLLAELDELRWLKHGLLRVGLPPVGGSVLFAPLFARFRTLYPGVEVRLLQHGGKRLQEALLAGEVDLAVALGLAPDFDCQHVAAAPLMALLNARHPLSQRPSTKMRELADTPFILFGDDSSTDDLVVQAAERQGVTPTVTARSNQLDFIIKLVQAGLGVAFMPRLLAEDASYPNVCFVPLDEPGTEWRVAFIWRHGGYLSHAARAWLALAKDKGMLANLPPMTG